ncbi:MAG: DUF3137 domain-containing protein [Rhodospirillaceae bacterium]|jgi:hypothetical protein|nr:DUF3137 domain-containing protein [Rhodospirillaceae bacterium]MBT5895084.1 DUF3137 domain-containing protein [Rhodospirillaceae bacterium]MBT6427797.1 DUF3137 domain-containing protein [Rhodospirillaceae bacterium]MBT7758577.1 DUF3137 domain-containing protein [Rhodospirillaceae bacterium]
MILVRLGVGFTAWLAALPVIGMAFLIPFGEKTGTAVGGVFCFLMFFAVLGMAAASPTVRVAFGRGLKLIGGAFWTAIAILVFFHFLALPSMPDARQLGYGLIPVSIIGSVFGGLLFLAGYFMTRKSDAGAPGFLARRLGPFLERRGRGLFNARRVHAQRRLQQVAEVEGRIFDESLPHLRGFNDYYREHIEDWMSSQEQRRKAALGYRLKVLVIGLPIMAVISIILAALASSDNDFWNGVLGFIILLGWLFVIGLAISKGEDLSDDVKAFMIKHLCDFFELSYDPQEMPAGLHKYVSLDLIPSHASAMIDEAFTAERENVSMFMADVTAYGYRGTGVDRHREVQFAGAILEFTYRKQFKGQTIAFSDRGLIGNLLKGSWRSEQRIRLENAEFEDRFEVFGTDEIESRYLMTPLFMERMVALSDLIGSSKKMRFAFAEDRLLVVVPGWDLFEAASLAHAMNDPLQVQTFLNEVGLIMGIADTMKLNLDSRI